MSSALLAPDRPGLIPTEWGLMVPPRFATPRDHSRPTLGGAVAKIGAARRRPLMPWQRMVADVASEVDPVTGMFLWPLVVVSVQRQAGKTDLDLDLSVQRCLMGPDRKIWHTAQTGQDAAAKWEELAKEVTGPASPLRTLVRGKPSYSNGKQCLTFVNGSELRPHPPTRDALHGKQSDTNNVDEAWAHDDETGDAIFQAIVPTQATRNQPPWSGAQTIIWSAAGDRRSTWFRKLVNRGRAGEPGLAFFEFGIPDDADPMDLETIAAYHPAFGHTISMDTLVNAQVVLRDKPGEFARAYGNRWTGAGERIIPAAEWANASTVADLPPGLPAFGVATSWDGSASAIVAAVADEAGEPWAELVEHRPGRSWVVPRLEELTERHANVGVAIDRKGPAGPIADAWTVAEHDLLPIGGVEYAAACADLLDRITEQPAARVHVRLHEDLDLAAEWAAKRLTSDGAWVFSRSKSGGDIGPVEALALASYAVARNPQPEEKPETSWG